MLSAMRKRWTRWTVLGHDVMRRSRLAVGTVVDTYPFDGGEVELVVVRLNGAFGGRRMLAVDDLWMDAWGLRTPYSAWQIEDSPPLTQRPPGGRRSVPRAQLLALRGAGRDLRGRVS